MIVGVAREVKRQEYRVGITPAGCAELAGDGHQVLAEVGAGAGSGFGDEEYRSAGAMVVDRQELFKRAEMLVKVKEPLPEEYGLLREGQTLFTYLHLAPNRPLAEALCRAGVTALGYETLERDGTLPLLAPMSEIAGRMAPLMGAWFLQRPRGGTGVLPCGATGVAPARALVLGAGVVGSNAVRVCVGIGCETVVMNKGIERLARLDELFPGRVRTLSMNREALAVELRAADLVIGAVYVTGERTPRLIERQHLAGMKQGSVIVDVAVDQGGCAATTRPTCHDDPVYEVDGVLHYAVANMPGAYPRTSTLALTNATLPYVRLLARLELDAALRESPPLATALNVRGGRVVHEAVAAALAKEG